VLGCEKEGKIPIPGGQASATKIEQKKGKNRKGELHEKQLNSMKTRTEGAALQAPVVRW